MTELLGRNIVLYDLEIKREVGSPLENGKNLTWNDKDRMGISCGVLFDYQTGDTTVYLDDNLVDLVVRLNNARLVVGFNVLGFDDLLLKATLPDLSFDARVPRYDLLVEGRKGIGWTESKPFPKGCRLDDFLSGTFGQSAMKTIDGGEAPKMWARGEMGRLISYCLADVAREKRFFEHVFERGQAITQTNGKHHFASPTTFYLGGWSDDGCQPQTR